MAQKQKQERNDYILITNVQKDFQGMCDEKKQEYREIWTECLEIIKDCKGVDKLINVCNNG
jgi:hypothetical protein